MEATPEVAIATKHLGKLPPKFDERTLRLANYVTRRAALRAVPDRFDLMRLKGLKGMTFPMWRNGGPDAIGDCGAVGLGHLGMVTSRGTEVPTEDAVIRFYSRVSGYDPVTGANDNGVHMLDAMNKAQEPAYELGEPIGPFVAVDPARDDLVRYALWAFGGLYSGWNLPVTAQTQEKVWQYVPNVNGNEAGSWGGHATAILPKATKTKVLIATWGAIVEVTEEFRDHYNDETFCYVDEDWIATAHNGKVHGLDLAALKADLASLRR